jgi:excisionase family DNA binding protein
MNVMQQLAEQAREMMDNSLSPESEVSVQDAALYLGVTSQRVSDLCSQGEIQAHKPEGQRKWSIPFSEVQRMFNELGEISGARIAGAKMYKTSPLTRSQLDELRGLIEEAGLDIEIYDMNTNTKSKRKETEVEAETEHE